MNLRPKPKWWQKMAWKHRQCATENWPKNIGNVQAHTKTKTMTENWPENKGNVQALTKTKTTTEIGLKTQETCRPKQKLKWQQKTGPKAGETFRPKQKPKWRQKTGLKTGNVQAQTKTKAMTEKRPQNRKHANIYTCRFYLVGLPIFLQKTVYVSYPLREQVHWTGALTYCCKTVESTHKGVN